MPPVIRHTNMAARKRYARRVMKIFFTKVEADIEKMADKFLDLTDAQVDEHLLKMRKALVKTVKQGMLERKDMEVKIASLACLVWWHRQDSDARWAREMSE